MNRGLAIVLAAALLFASVAPPAARRAEASPGAQVSVSVFYADLSPWGHWVDMPSYGWCWVPDQVYAGWRPYSDGYWVYTDLGWTWKEVSGRGTIHSYETVLHAIQPGFKEITPYTVVLVELDEQRGQPTPDEALRIVGNLVKPDGVTMKDDKQVAIGKRVRVVFQDLAEHMALAQWTLSDEPPQGRVWRLPG